MVVSKKLRMRFMKLTHDRLGHVGDGKMIWALKQRCVVSWSRPMSNSVYSANV